jgi:GNAT superfamily N-acetyltransferase
MTSPAERLSIVQDHAPKAEDVAAVRAGLMTFNESAVGPATVVPIALYIRDAEGRIRGGLTGFLAWNWLSVDLLWVDAPLRGQGYGAQLLAHAERLAREAACVAVRLDTYDVQARPFYEHHGYELWGTLEGYPAGGCTFHMRKSL